MIVEVSGISDQSANTKSILKEAAKFYASILLDEDIIKDIYLDIEINFDVECAGHCVTEDDSDFPRNFTIYLNPEYTTDTLCNTLAHEMVHLKQFATGELYNILSLKPEQLEFGHVWQGKQYEPKEGEFEHLDYPWEVEAYGRQPGLYHRWQNRKV